MPHIDQIEYGVSSGRLREIYDQIISKRGNLSEILKVQSLNPESIVIHMDLYIGIMFGRSPLKRPLRELLGVVVSKRNKCRYCTIHHLTALNAYWKDKDRIDKLLINIETADLSDPELALCRYAISLTENDPETEFDIIIQKLKDLKLSDRKILDATLIIAYFNFVNRIVIGLGVELSDDPDEYIYT